MFSNISWKEYSIFILIVVFIYYIIILVVFYKREIVSFISGLHFLNKSSNGNEYPSLERGIDILDPEYTESPDIVMHLQNEIKTQLERAKAKKEIREEIIMSLQMILKNYDSVKQSQYKQFINNYIKVVCENICSIHLEVEEIDQLWNR